MNRKKILIDTDLGDDIDDAFALCLAMQSPEVEIVGVTTVHRCAGYRAKMAKALLIAGGFASVPVHAGISEPLKVKEVHGRTLNFNERPHSYTEEYDGVEYDGDDAVSFLEETLSKSEEPLTVVTLGALTNIAVLLEKRPDLTRKIDTLYIMGGAYAINWGEYNFCCDPDAAAYVLSLNLPTRCLGIDVTFQCKLSGKLLEAVQNHPHPCLQMLFRMRRLWGSDVYLHDPLTLLSSFDDEYITWERRKCMVEHNSERSNGYVVNLSDPNWGESAENSNLYVATAVSAAGFVEDCAKRLLRFARE